MSGNKSAIDIDHLAELREVRGLTYAQIAPIVGRSPGAVAWQCLKNGIEKAGGPPARPHNVGTMVCDKGDMTIRRYSAEDDAELLRLEATGMKYHVIAREMGRANSSIRGRLLTLARREERGL